ncbi:hypothetical protein PPERSA_08925 [Pseudocohnilembus persalinus]|uniref:Uncharacterized protein n=1 Tax=Pseudocohnilembus persalinus TaxID=266149 RepID=A0A0V0R3M9_PSEPJ|nr:hypothetical protein PPERSA_08925 [Pseudocohnilembus persalinus]|eukprot:KRX08821.1 hypothetical protein PPERSA_08925 [Pseudocohnilembus persalinus]
METLKKIKQTGDNVLQFNKDILLYSSAKLGSKLGLCQIEEVFDSDSFEKLELEKKKSNQTKQQQQLQQKQQQGEHNSRLKVYFLKQFSKYWIIHNVGQNFTLSFEEFQKVVSRYAGEYNQKSEQLLQDFYESASEIWTDLVRNKEQIPSTDHIKYVILKIVAHTLDKNIKLEEKETENQNFGETLFDIFNHFKDKQLNMNEKSIVKHFKNNFYTHQMDHIKACVEYCNFFKDFILEFFPSNQEYNHTFTKRVKYQKLLKKSTKMFSSAYCKFFMLLLSTLEKCLDTILSLIENPKNYEIMNKLEEDSKNLDFDDINRKFIEFPPVQNLDQIAEQEQLMKQYQMQTITEDLQEDSSYSLLSKQESESQTQSQQQLIQQLKENDKQVNLDEKNEQQQKDNQQIQQYYNLNNEQNSQQQKPVQGFKMRKLSEKQKNILQKEQNIKSKIQIVALKIFLIFQRGSQFFSKVRSKNFIQNKQNDFKLFLFEKKNLCKNYLIYGIQKSQYGFYMVLNYGNDYFTLMFKNLKEMLEQVQNFMRKQKEIKEESGLKGLVLYNQCMLRKKKRQILDYKIKKYQKIIDQYKQMLIV